MPHDTPRPPLVDDGPRADPNAGAPAGAIRITTGDVNRLTTREERTGARTTREVLDLTRQRKAAETAERSRQGAAGADPITARMEGIAAAHRTVVPRAGLHDGQDPDPNGRGVKTAELADRQARVLSTRALLAGLKDDSEHKAWPGDPAALAELYRRAHDPAMTGDARGEAADAIRDYSAPIPADPPADPGILEQNGYAAVRASMLGVCQALGGIPREAVDAALAYNAAAIRRLRLDAGKPRAAEALKAAEREARYLETVQRMHRDLRELEQRMAAADRITAR